MRNIQLEDHIADQLAALAAARHMSVNDYLQNIISAHRPDTSSSTSSDEDDFDKELDALLFDGPSPPGNFSREDIYFDHP